MATQDLANFRRQLATIVHRNNPSALSLLTHDLPSKAGFGRNDWDATEKGVQTSLGKAFTKGGQDTNVGPKKVLQNLGVAELPFE